MHPFSVRRQRAGSLAKSFVSVLVATSVGLLSACGDSQNLASDATAVSAMDSITGPDTAGGSVLETKAAINKVDPRVRPGVEAPLDSTPQVDKPDPAPPTPGQADTSQRRFLSGFESGTLLTPPSGYRNGDRLIVGGDTAPYLFQDDLWQSPVIRRHLVHSQVWQESAAPVTDYLTASLKSVTGRTGATTRALSLHSKALSGGGSNQEIAVQFSEMSIEPVLYQRMWVKFDTRTLADAMATGQTHFHQIFWEATANPDYRLRLKLRYAEGKGLYWQAKADAMNDNESLWEVNLLTAPVVLAAHDQAGGWHQVEIWLDRAGQRFKVNIDGQSLVDHQGPLAGASGQPIDALKTMVVHSISNPLAETLFDDVEYWAVPPADAFGLPRPG